MNIENIFIWFYYFVRGNASLYTNLLVSQGRSKDFISRGPGGGDLYIKKAPKMPKGVNSKNGVSPPSKRAKNGDAGNMVKEKNVRKIMWKGG